MAPRFEAEIQQLEDFSYVKIVGVLDEDNELAPLVHRVRGSTAIIDLAGVEGINNCGVRDWVNCLEGLQARDITVVLVECSPAIVAKLNSVSNFIENGFIKNFYIPYYCQACEAEKAMLVDLDELRHDGAVKTPTCRCDSCDGIMAFDDMEESYFRFVKDIREVVIPAHVQALMDQITPRTGERKIVSRISAGSSSFAGIPATSSNEFGTGVSSVVPPSVASLRRLRDKTGLRTLRPAAEEKDEEQSSPARRWWLLLIAGLSIIAATAAALILFVL